MVRSFFPVALFVAAALAAAAYSAMTAAAPSGPTYRIAISGTT